MPMQICCPLRDEITEEVYLMQQTNQTWRNKHYDWFALVNKYFRGKIMQTSLTLTEVWPIRDRIIRQKYYCITVHYHTVCTSENGLGQTV